MSAQERKYMGDDVAGSGTEAAKEIHNLEGKADELRKESSKLTAENKRLAAEIADLKKQASREAAELKKVISQRDNLQKAKDEDAKVWAQSLQKAKRLIQSQGQALIADHYGPSKYGLLIKARTLLSMSGPANTPDRYRPPGQSQEEADDLWRQVVADWFEDYEKEMRGIACEPKQEAASA